MTSLKLLEKGLSKEDLAVAVLLDFPAQMIVGWLAAKWSRPEHVKHPLTSSSSGGGFGVGGTLRPWIYAFWARLGMAAFAALLVYCFPSNGIVGNGYFGVVIAATLLASLTRWVLKSL